MEQQLLLEDTVRQHNHTAETLINHKAARVTQHEKILRLLRTRPGEWIPLPSILALGIAQYGRVINDLRTAKYDGNHYIIENKILEVVNGSKHTAFRIIE